MTVGPTGRPAVFVDRDGTVIEEREYLADPADVRLLPGAAEGLGAFHAAGFAVVIVTNQSGIARGYYDEAAYAEVAREVVRQLEDHAVTVLASYHCPHHPDITGPCQCRKPATGLFERAAAEHGLDTRRSVFVGDRVSDVAPARALGGKAILVSTGYGAAEAVRAPRWVTVVNDLGDAARVATSGPGGVDTPHRFP